MKAIKEGQDRMQWELFGASEAIIVKLLHLGSGKQKDKESIWNIF